MKFYFLGYRHIIDENRNYLSSFSRYTEDVNDKIASDIVKKVDKQIKRLYFISSDRSDILDSCGRIGNLLVTGRGRDMLLMPGANSELDFGGNAWKRGLEGRPRKGAGKLLGALGLEGLTQKEIEQYNSDNICDMLEEYLKYDDGKTAILFAADTEVMSFMQNDDKVRRLCYFGDEKLSKFGNVTVSKVGINPAEIVEFEVGLPKEIGYDGKMETIAERKIAERAAAENQKQ